MDDDDVELTPSTIVSAQEIDEVVSQFRLFNRRLSQQQVLKVVSELPKMSEVELIASGRQDDVCPICFNSFLAALAEEELALAMDSPAHPPDELGVTRLQNTCGHIFCRKDIIKWITEGHDSCPACRRPLVADEDRREGSLSDGWIRPYVVDLTMVVRETDLPAHLPTLSVDSFRVSGNAGMYS